ncbi:MAG: type 1 glutamine amidotransferase [Thermodesulfobacteriota bacterium]
MEFEDAAGIADWAAARGHAVAVSRLFAGDPLPEMAAFDFLMVMGGPMNVYEHQEHPWLEQEKRFLRQALDADKVVLGVCLGAQLLADVLGGSIRQVVHKEIGWLPVRSTPEALGRRLFKRFPLDYTAFHWHGETFSIPPGAVRVAESEACHNQGFALGDRVVGLQFHLEATARSLEQLMANCGSELVEGPYIQQPDQLRAGLHNAEQAHRLLAQLLDRMAEEANA